MFGGGGNDPFGNPFEHMHRQMRQMDNMMNVMLGDAFNMLNNFGMGVPRHPMLMDNGFGHHAPPNGRHQRTNGGGHHDMNMMMSPFGGFSFGGGFIHQLHNVHERAMQDPNTVVLSESTMISYDGNGQPKVVQSSTRKAGDVKETRKALRDGEHEEVTIGHSIGNKTHLVEKKRDKDGRVRQQQKFVNLREEEAHDFNERFKRQARDNLTGIFGGKAQNGRNAIDNGNGGRGGGGRRAMGNGGGQPAGVGTSSSGYQRSNEPIITIPDDEEDEKSNRRGPNGRRYDDDDDDIDIDVVYSNRGTGPTIQEIVDHEADNANPKRRKGVFGKFLG